MKSLFLTGTLVLLSVVTLSAQQFNPYQDPSVYVGNGQFRPYTPEFESDLLGNDPEVYNKAWNNQYSFTPNPNSKMYDRRGIPRVFFVAPSRY